MMLPTMRPYPRNAPSNLTSKRFKLVIGGLCRCARTMALWDWAKLGSLEGKKMSNPICCAPLSAKVLLRRIEPQTNPTMRPQQHTVQKTVY